MTWYLLALVLVLWVATATLWDWWRSGRMFCGPLPMPFRDRPSQESVWKQNCSEAKLEQADAFLQTLCEAFGFNPDDRYCFAPADRLLDVYQACYPRWKFWQVADSLELESLMLDLSRRFTVDESEWPADITLGEIVGRLYAPPEAFRQLADGSDSEDQ